METPVATEPTFWNNLADRYAKQPVELPEAFEQKIEVTRSHMTPESLVLDIGCGTGSLVLRLADAGREVHGLDFSSEMIRIAREKSAAGAVENVTFHEARAESAFEQFEPGSLDIVCAYSLLHLVDDRETLLAQIFALLKPGGLLISSTPCIGESWIPYRPILAVMRWLGKAPPVAIIKVSQLKEGLGAAGFESLERPDVGAKDETAFLVCQKPA